MKNSFLAKQQAIQRECVNQGIRHGQQYAIDIVEVALHRQGWGYDRIKRLVDDIRDIADYYAPSMHPGMEQEVYQERMDRELKDLVKGRQEFATFEERYPLVRKNALQRMPRR